MSFILDALRKSEGDRQREASPNVAHMPMAVQQDRMPRWGIALIAALLACVVLLGSAWWINGRSGGEGAAVVDSGSGLETAARSQPQPEPRRAPAGTAAPAPAEPLRRPVAQPQQADANASTSISTPQPPAAEAPARVASSPGARETAQRGLLPSPGELRAQGIEVPPVDLQLHSFSDAATERFVFVNGGRYHEGDTLPQGLSVESIVPDGVVLSYQGSRFLLVPD